MDLLHPAMLNEKYPPGFAHQCNSVVLGPNCTRLGPRHGFSIMLHCIFLTSYFENFGGTSIEHHTDCFERPIAFLQSFWAICLLLLALLAIAVKFVARPLNLRFRHIRTCGSLWLAMIVIGLGGHYRGVCGQTTNAEILLWLLCFVVSMALCFACNII